MSVNGQHKHTATNGDAQMNSSFLRGGAFSYKDFEKIRNNTYVLFGKRVRFSGGIFVFGITAGTVGTARRVATCHMSRLPGARIRVKAAHTAHPTIESVQCMGTLGKEGAIVLLGALVSRLTGQDQSRLLKNRRFNPDQIGIDPAVQELLDLSPATAA